MTSKKRTYRSGYDPETGTSVRLRRGDIAATDGTSGKEHWMVYAGEGRFAHQTYEGFRLDEVSKDRPFVRVHRADDDQLPTIMGRILAEMAANRSYSRLDNTCEDGATRVVFGDGFSPTRRKMAKTVGLTGAGAGAGALLGRAVGGEKATVAGAALGAAVGLLLSL